jgi:hypothetical protein
LFLLVGVGSLLHTRHQLYGTQPRRALRLIDDWRRVFGKWNAFSWAPECLERRVFHLACAAKSNAGYQAYNAARAFVRQDGSRSVPMHLRNAPTALMKQLGHGHAYRYAHDEPNAYAAGESYLPEDMDEPRWYRPVPRGLEQKIAEKLAFLRGLDAAHGGSGEGEDGN